MRRRRGRRKGLLYPQIQRRVKEVVKRYPGASTFEVAKRANISWATAKKYLNTLRVRGEIRKRKVGKKTVWY